MAGRNIYMVFKSTYYNLAHVSARNSAEPLALARVFHQEYRDAERLLGAIDARWRLESPVKYDDLLKGKNLEDPATRKEILRIVSEEFGHDYTTDTNLHYVYHVVYDYEHEHGGISPEAESLSSRMLSFHGVIEIEQIMDSFKIDVIKYLQGDDYLSYVNELLLMDKIATVERFIETYNH